MKAFSFKDHGIVPLNRDCPHCGSNSLRRPGSISADVLISNHVQKMPQISSYHKSTMFCWLRIFVKPNLVWDCGCASTRTAATAPKQAKRMESIQLKKKRKEKQKKSQSSDFGLNSRERKSLKQKLLHGEQGTVEGHIYKQLYPWKTKYELAEHLKSTQVYHSDGLIALSKPYGVPQHKPSAATEEGTQTTIVQTLFSGSTPDHMPAVQDTLPILKDLYGVEHLEVVKSTERWSSGLILLSTCSKLTEKVQKSLRRSKAFQQPPQTFWAVTVGVPRPVTVATKTAISLEYISGIGKVPVIQKKYSQASVSRGEAKTSVVEHRALLYNKDTDASLVEVNIQTLKWHFLRVWLSHSYSPVLGDAMYSSRVKTISGKKLQVSPHNLTSYEPQFIPAALFSKLELPTKAVEMIPCHLHLAKIKLARFNKDNSDLIISAPPPSYFMWTCRQLGLMSGDDGVTEADSEATQHT
ncbi:mitochondrial mRNA pseudouridine synthase RPUSD3-like [Homarus americanus]|uniref:mitochondrial mRNA pseudouridine synthase RPUSD3-like n=1 Tax=Homarus americanus TaxID=6706 RepID=UPI001C494918|nr:mitochondrial mRNA pseudouridine synthase RPUSD3-like [Homarus americanus]